MKRFVLIYTLLLIVGQTNLLAQNYNNGDYQNQQNGYSAGQKSKDSTHVNYKTIAPEVHMWTVDERLGNMKEVEIDTIPHLFLNSNLGEGMTGHNNYLGNLGSPLQSHVFFERPETSEFLFSDPYSNFITLPGDFKFTNTKSPYTNLTYYKGGSTPYNEERFKAYFSVNVNKRLGFGFKVDYLYGRGLYSEQTTSFFNGALFGSYIGDHYQAHLIYNSNYLKMRENGGIEDDRYITNPIAMSEGKKTYEPANIPTIFTNTWNRNKNDYIFLTHRYNLGFTREKRKTTSKETEKELEKKAGKEIGKRLEKVPEKGVEKKQGIEPGTELKNPVGKEVPKDLGKSSEKVETEFVPVTSFIHTLKLEQARRRFTSYDDPSGYYDTIYINKNSTATQDTTSYMSVKNTFAIALQEGFNKYAKAGLTGFIEHEFRQYTLMNADSITTHKYTENEVYVGGELAKRQGNTLHYNATGEVGLLGKSIGQFRLKGNMDLNFKLWNDTVSFVARANISNTLPAFYMRHYHSNHYWWDNENMDKEFRTRLEGEMSIKHWQTNLKAGVENIKNYTYFNNKAIPAQFADNIQILSACLQQNFKFGIFHLDNEVVFQKSSNQTIIPLPDFSLYHNLYLQTRLAKKVLFLELGADVRYFTKYYAPAYSAAIGQYHLQSSSDQVEIGGYPIVNLYANLHLKRTRIFVMMYHVNKGMGNSNYFLVPHYPINPRMLKLGFSWNFYD